MRIRRLIHVTIVGLFASIAHAASPEIVVYSGVPCGIAAAVTAAREGSRVVLIEPTNHVGGLSTSGINTAESEHMLKRTIDGFTDEFYRRQGKHYGTWQPKYFFASSVATVTRDGAHLRSPLRFSTTFPT